MVAFGTGSGRATYTVIESYASDATATRTRRRLPDDPRGPAAGHRHHRTDLCYPGPAGALNMAFHRNAIALVTRPLAIPNNAMGVLSHVGVYNDIAMRVSMQYSIANGGTVVNLDILAGVAILDTEPGGGPPRLSPAVSRHEPARPGAIRAGRPFLRRRFDMDLSDLFLMLKQYGPLVVVVLFFLWQNWQRELRMDKRINKLEDEQRDVLMPLVERCTDVITQNTMMMERLEKSLDNRFECPMRKKCPEE